MGKCSKLGGKVWRQESSNYAEENANITLRRDGTRGERMEGEMGGEGGGVAVRCAKKKDGQQSSLVVDKVKQIYRTENCLFNLKHELKTLHIKIMFDAVLQFIYSY